MVPIRLSQPNFAIWSWWCIPSTTWTVLESVGVTCVDFARYSSITLGDYLLFRSIRRLFGPILTICMQTKMSDEYRPIAHSPFINVGSTSKFRRRFSTLLWSFFDVQWKIDFRTSKGRRRNFLTNFSAFLRRNCPLRCSLSYCYSIVITKSQNRNNSSNAKNWAYIYTKT